MTCFEYLRQTDKTLEMPIYPIKPVSCWDEHYCEYTSRNPQAEYADTETAFEGGLIKYGGDITLAIKYALKARNNGSNSCASHKDIENLESVIENN